MEFGFGFGCSTKNPPTFARHILTYSALPAIRSTLEVTIRSSICIRSKVSGTSLREGGATRSDEEGWDADVGVVRDYTDTPKVLSQVLHHRTRDLLTSILRIAQYPRTIIIAVQDRQPYHRFSLLLLKST